MPIQLSKELAAAALRAVSKAGDKESVIGLLNANVHAADFFSFSATLAFHYDHWDIARLLVNAENVQSADKKANESLPVIMAAPDETIFEISDELAEAICRAADMADYPSTVAEFRKLGVELRYPDAITQKKKGPGLDSSPGPSPS